MIDYINGRITGRIAMTEDDAALVLKYAAKCRTWVEIGTLWGGSAILAALASPAVNVYCIDPMTGYYGEVDRYVGEGKLPTIEDVIENFKKFQVADRVVIIRAKSYPFPIVNLPIGGILIDGAHDYPSVMQDIESAQNYSNGYILVHDFADDEIKAACKSMKWRIIESCETMGVFAK